MRGFLVLGLVATAALLLSLSAGAQANVVNTAFEGVTLTPFAGDPIDVGTESYADLMFQFCYETGGLMPPPDNSITITLAITASPPWATASLDSETLSVLVEPANAKGKYCYSPPAPPQVKLRPTDAVGGESGQVDVLITGEGGGTLKKPADATASTPVNVATADQDLLAQLQENSTGGPDVDVGDLDTGNSNDSPGFDAVFAIAVGAAVLVAAARRRKQH